MIREHIGWLITRSYYLPEDLHDLVELIINKDESIPILSLQIVIVELCISVQLHLCIVIEQMK